jgi:peroxiredoxin
MRAKAIWTNRWLRAGLVAIALGTWPAWRLLDHANPQPANQAPLDFSLKDMNGQTVHLSDFKGRPLIINFWATWCGPCKAEIPGFIRLVDKYRDQHLTVLGISTDDAPADLRTFAAQHKMNYPVLVGLGHDNLLDAYDAAFAIPVSWFIRPDGTVYLKHPGTETEAWFDQQVQAIVGY